MIVGQFMSDSANLLPRIPQTFLKMTKKIEKYVLSYWSRSDDSFKFIAIERV